MRIQWAFQKEKTENTASHFHIFVGNLSGDVADPVLLQAFQHIGECSDARVMWDHSTGRSKGFGFVSFRYGCSALYLSLKILAAGQRLNFQFSAPFMGLPFPICFACCDIRRPFSSALPSLCLCALIHFSSPVQIAHFNCCAA